MNHWVACIKACGRSPGDDATAPDETTQTFIAQYYSLERIVIPAIADGDCALDVMCLMAGMDRRLASRASVREQLCRFLLRHAGNRALIASMYHTGEVSTHLGQFELESAGAALCNAGESHGDGDATDPKPPEARSFTDEEFNAVKWKRRLQKAAPQAICNVLRGLPGWSIEQIKTEYSQREKAPTTRKPAATFLLKRDCHLKDRTKAAKHFLQWCRERHGNPLQARHAELLKKRQDAVWVVRSVRAES